MSELQSDENNYLLKKCKNFVSEIESYVGHDPLDAWYRYLLWFEDIFWINNADQETIFYKVLGQCLSCFENTSQYIQDRRLIRLFCKYVSDEVCTLCALSRLTLLLFSHRLLFKKTS